MVNKLDEKQKNLESSALLSGMIGNCDQIGTVLSILKKVADSEVHCLFIGENGTGKSFAARAVHEMRGLKNETFITIHGSLDPNLIQAQLSDLIGFIKNHNQKAAGKKNAIFDKGTLLIEDIHRLQFAQQLQVMHLVEEATSFRDSLPSSNSKRLYVFSTAPHKLSEFVEKGHFRQDLYYSLSEVEVYMPPLRDRGQDIILLAKHFLGKFSTRKRTKVRDFHNTAINAMLNHSWPGNIDELQNRIRRAITLAESSSITSKDLGLSIEDGDSHSQEKADTNQISVLRKKTEKEAIMDALKICNGNISKTAKLLGISRPTLYDKLRQYDKSHN